MTRPPGAAVLLLALAAACSGSGQATTSPTAQPLRCADVFVAGAVIPTALDEGCVETAGRIIVPGIATCADGRKLLADARGWGYLGEVIHLRTAATDPAYRPVYRACNG